MLRAHERIVREALRAHGGSEVKTMGDGFMASFSSATRALECAIAMQKAFAEHNQTAEEPIRVRIGLNAGEPIAEEEDLFGTAVNLAARIAAQAEGGEILASNVVQAAGGRQGVPVRGPGRGSAARASRTPCGCTRCGGGRTRPLLALCARLLLANAIVWPVMATRWPRERVHALIDNSDRLVLRQVPKQTWLERHLKLALQLALAVAAEVGDALASGDLGDRGSAGVGQG